MMKLFDADGNVPLHSAVHAGDIKVRVDNNTLKIQIELFSNLGGDIMLKFRRSNKHSAT